MLKPPEQWIDFLRAEAFDLEHYFEPDSIEEMWANDILAGVGIDDVKRTLAIWARLLKPGGALYVDHLAGDQESTSVSYFTRLLDLTGFDLEETQYTKGKVRLKAKRR